MTACIALPLQELLEHPFLRPTAPDGASPSDKLVGLSQEQLKLLLSQVGMPPSRHGLCAAASCRHTGVALLGRRLTRIAAF